MEGEIEGIGKKKWREMGRNEKDMNEGRNMQEEERKIDEKWRKGKKSNRWWIIEGKERKRNREKWGEMRKIWWRNAGRRKKR